MFRLALPAVVVLLAEPAFAAIPVPPPTPAALAYQHGLDLFYLFDFAFGLVLAAVFMFTRWSAQLRDMAARVGGHRWFFTVTLTVVCYGILTTLIGLPFDACEHFILPHKYGVSSETAGHWAKAQITALLVSAVLTALVAWIPFLLLRRAPRSWFLWATAAMLPLLIVFVAIGPVFITPLFNTFTPLADKRLETVLRAEAARAGLGDAPILVMDQSTTSKAPGAYVTGLFGTRRIVLYDTLVKSFDEKQIAFVLGHEMKHYLMGDVWKLVALLAAVLLGGFTCVHLLGNWVLRQWGRRFGVTHLSDPAAVPVLLAAFSVAAFVLTPVVNLQSQSIEHEADRFGLELTQDNDAAASAFVKLQAGALGVPDPGFVQRVWRTNHPTLRDRIDFANDYHPWRDGAKLRYGAFMKPAN